MELILISPTSKKTYQVSWVEIDTTVGNFVIKPTHAPMVLILASHSTTSFELLSNQKQESLPISGGIAHITPTHTTLLLSA